MVTAMELSKYIISKCIKNNNPISNLQLQKILYYIQYEVLKQTNNRAFPDDIEAWQFGPVIPNIYYSFCNYGSLKIPISFLYEEYENIYSFKYKNIVDDVIEKKSTLNPWYLVSDTHKKNGAWDLTYNSGKGLKQIISVENIKKSIEYERV